jgi:phage-related protein
MAVFDWIESAATTLDEEPRVLQTRFGDGYAQRQADGLNPLAQQWSVKFSAVDNANADDLIAFLRARGGVEAFDWTPLWHTAAIRVVCPRWSRSQPTEFGQCDISATFVQVFEP